ncbi:MAG: hypothetical protein IJ811_04010 [Clostridia bacterium]|nr:hypothetical protein [Clostridia bacterium]
MPSVFHINNKLEGSSIFLYVVVTIFIVFVIALSLVYVFVNMDDGEPHKKRFRVVLLVSIIVLPAIALVMKPASTKVFNLYHDFNRKDVFIFKLIYFVEYYYRTYISFEFIILDSAVWNFVVGAILIAAWWIFVIYFSQTIDSMRELDEKAQAEADEYNKTVPKVYEFRTHTTYGYDFGGDAYSNSTTTMHDVTKYKRPLPVAFTTYLTLVGLMYFVPVLTVVAVTIKLIVCSFKKYKKY